MKTSTIQQSLNLSNQKRQIGAGEGKFRREDAVVFDIRGNMLVVRVGGGQRRVLRVRERVIPIQFLFVMVCGHAVFDSRQLDELRERQLAAGDFVTIVLNLPVTDKSQVFQNAQHNVSIE